MKNPNLFFLNENEKSTWKESKETPKPLKIAKRNEKP
jgi:hypothetical protein